LPNNINQVRRN